jgi:hypothetical protein
MRWKEIASQAIPWLRCTSHRNAARVSVLDVTRGNNELNRTENDLDSTPIFIQANPIGSMTIGREKDNLG